MTGKENRQTLIVRLVREGRVSTQAGLLATLRKRRLPVDQSTLSRDLAELDIRKAGGHYLLQEPGEAPVERRDYSSVVRGLSACGPHLIVITTETGQAQPVAVAIDRAADPSIAGTLAGDDTIFVATKTRRMQMAALRRLRRLFGE